MLPEPSSCLGTNDSPWRTTTSSSLGRPKSPVVRHCLSPRMHPALQRSSGCPTLLFLGCTISYSLGHQEGSERLTASSRIDTSDVPCPTREAGWRKFVTGRAGPKREGGPGQAHAPDPTSSTRSGQRPRGRYGVKSVNMWVGGRLGPRWRAHFGWIMRGESGT